MASVAVRNLLLSQTTVLGTKKSAVVCTGVLERKKRDPETRQVLDELEGYACNVLSGRGETQTVKLPIDCKDEIVKIREALADDKIVKISFTKFVGRFWAMIDNDSGRIAQGVSANASGVQLVSVEEPEQDDFMDDIEL